MEELLNANARAVLAVVRESASHPTAQEVHDAVRLMRPGIGLATVYRILHQLTRQGMIRVWGYEGERVRYDGRADRHDHALCTVCGALLDLPLEIELSRTALEEAARAAGLELASYEVRMYGRCAHCQARRKA
jgi:Fur family peroxide stress response transcriptional regulator